MRCFIAVDLPEELKNSVCQIQKELNGRGTKLVEKENLHFTLKFLGEVSDEQQRLVEKNLQEIKLPPFPVTLKGVGFFPTPGFIRVVWIGADSDQFLELHNAVNKSLANFFPVEKPVPHLTLARVISQAYTSYLRDFETKYHNTSFGTFLVKELKLKKSILSGKGPVYEDVMTLKLVNDNDK
jgi:2'-5' RNA ligase